MKAHRVDNSKLSPAIAAATRHCESKLDIALKQLEAVDAVIQAWRDAKQTDYTVMLHLHKQVQETIKLCKSEEVS